MQLKRIEISGFRGIKRLSLSFDELTVLIGENAWGKSSLLDALDIALSPDAKFHTFHFDDFHVDYSAGHAKMNHLNIVLHWHEDYPGEHKARRYKAFSPVWVNSQDQCKALYYQITSSVDDDKITTHRRFLNKHGDPIPCDDSNKLAKQLMVLHPIVRIRDARRLREYRPIIEANKNGSNGNGQSNGNGAERRNDENVRIQRRLDNTCRRLMTKPGHVSQAEIKSSVNALRTLVDHYFAFTPHYRNQHFDRAHFPERAQYAINPLEQLTEPETTKQSRLVLMGLLNAFIRARGPVELKRISRPIMILEDPEGRLHPTILHQAWTFISKMPMQKILTTNSPDLCSVVPLECVQKLIRQPSKTQVYSILNHKLSRDEERRVTFHLRVHRPSALFARAWLLVEGETEVWLFNELARICGYNLAAEGVQIIEFTQSGLKPLIKVARHFGIEWHMIADGDMAGKKYADTVRNILDNEAERHRLTILPKRDIEHFLFFNGFEPLFRELANIPVESPVTPKKIIQRALKRHAKPDVALAMINFIEQENIDNIPILLRWILKRIVAMSRGQS
ncbi:ATP-dependent endonuclease [Photobacterium gaetbulicola]|uniref:ATP-dependent endonuclease n=1 Tax=Photobacterium gaetbulicola TaxID=1295392 RepID=A0A0B9G571_9GAMM|nr:ATP-dependent endonuclease [Photobacterium gaetbulicola]KHT63883.1 ATP-dependent endonuclease [Photobacterium gaetbulicola]